MIESTNEHQSCVAIATSQSQWSEANVARGIVGESTPSDGIYYRLVVLRKEHKCDEMGASHSDPRRSATVRST